MSGDRYAGGTKRDDLKAANDPDEVRTPEQRLEWPRFCAVGNKEAPNGVADWMQEVEQQIAALRRRMNELPAHATREPIRW